MSPRLKPTQIDSEPDTRTRIITLARNILETEGYSALTLRAVAKRVGLSPTAPYRHFEDGLPELLATIAIAGFEELIAAIEKSVRSSVHRERIVELALAYVRFGVERPDLYRTMFSPQIARQVELHDEMFEEGKIRFASRRTYQRVAEVRLQAFGAILVPLTEAVDDGALKDDDPENFGLALAAMVHGLVGEFIDEGLGIRVSQKQPWSKARRVMSESIVTLLLTGMEK